LYSAARRRANGPTGVEYCAAWTWERCCLELLIAVLLSNRHSFCAERHSPAPQSECQVCVMKVTLADDDFKVSSAGFLKFFFDPQITRITQMKNQSGAVGNL
jgi:hypothetical protein